MNHGLPFDSHVYHSTVTVRYKDGNLVWDNDRVSIHELKYDDKKSPYANFKPKYVFMPPLLFYNSNSTLFFHTSKNNLLEEKVTQNPNPGYSTTRTYNYTYRADGLPVYHTRFPGEYDITNPTYDHAYFYYY